jgi:ubiquinone/menaquinone biosynthesis C-methylase UbiE
MTLAPLGSRLKRVLEPEVMDSTDEARDYDAMDHAEVNRRFVADLLEAQRDVGLAAEALVLDLGTGTAQIPIELCAQNPRARITAIDMAQSMLELARANVMRRDLAERIAIECQDAKNLPYADGHFAIVMSNSIVHHIPDPRAVLAEAVRVVARGSGLVFVRDLARPSDDAHVRQLVEAYAAEANAHQRRLFEASLRAALSVEEIRAIVAELGQSAGDVLPTSDRHWTWRATF